jgi:hypothetical protein
MGGTADLLLHMVMPAGMNREVCVKLLNSGYIPYAMMGVLDDESL